MKMRSVGIVGVGHVGAHCAYSMAIQGVADEIILVDSNEQKAISECQDLRDAGSFLPHRVTFKTGDYADLKDCDVVVISVGIITKDKNRLSELNISVAMVNDIIPKIVAGGFNGIFVNITNPCDILTRQIQKVSGFPKTRVIGTGTGLDTSRFKAVLARDLDIDHKSLVAYTMGEHGDSQMAPWSHVTINGKPLDELAAKNPERYAIDKEAALKEAIGGGWVTYAGKGATEYGICSACTRLVNTIMHDEKAVFTAAVPLDGEYGETDIYTSTLAVIGKDGVEEVIELDLPEDELAAFKHSCDVVKEYISKIVE